MHTNLKTLLWTTAVVIALVGGPALYASAGTPNQASAGMMQGRQDYMMSGGTMMDQGSGTAMGSQASMMGMQGMMAMMNMMQQASQMMETCNRIMTSMVSNPSPAMPKQGKGSNKQG
ncbi:MAG TPA: hypothetical protein VMU87_12470 [Stellaceae bacterium]|nr:hypothetical protein [Stellaceae bacterium]